MKFKYLFISKYSCLDTVPVDKTLLDVGIETESNARYLRRTVREAID